MNIPTSLIVVLLVVAWLVVLVPMVARRRERVPQAQPAGEGFRVLRRASASLRRRPGRGAKGRTVTNMDGQRDSAPDAPTEALVTVGADRLSEPADAAQERAAAQAAHSRRVGSLPADPETARRDTGLADEPAPDREPTLDGPSIDQEPNPHHEMPVRPAPDAATDERDDPGQSNSSRAGSIPDELDEDEWAAHAAAAPAPGRIGEVHAEQLRPVPHRPGRGGFDPEAAEATRSYRYQQRRRVTLILLVATVAFTVAALVIINWLWFGAAVSCALLVGYLAYLRRQVRIEAAIRQKRMERLQRARQIRPEYGRAPRRPRAGMSAAAPGRTVVDLDDDDPGFDDLEEYQQPMPYRRAAGQ